MALPHFLRHPVNGMRALPDWPWLEILCLQSLFAAACAALGNVIARHYMGIALGLVLGPIVNIVGYTIYAGFFYYVITLAFGRPVTFRAVYLNVAFSSIPMMLTNIIAPLFPLALTLGIAASLTLLYFGLVSNFGLERVRVRVLLASLMALYFLTWGVTLFTVHQRREHLRVKATPESLDILEHEIGPAPDDSGEAEPAD